MPKKKNNIADPSDLTHPHNAPLSHRGRVLDVTAALFSPLCDRLVHAQLKWVIHRVCKVFLLLVVSHWISPVYLPSTFFQKQKGKPAWVGNVGLTLRVQHFNGLANYGWGEKKNIFFLRVGIWVM